VPSQVLQHSSCAVARAIRPRCMCAVQRRDAGTCPGRARRYAAGACTTALPSATTTTTTATATATATAAHRGVVLILQARHSPRANAPPPQQPSSLPAHPVTSAAAFNHPPPVHHQTLHYKAPFVLCNHPSPSVARDIVISQRVSPAWRAVRQRCRRRSSWRACTGSVDVLWLPPGALVARANFPSSCALIFIVAHQVRLSRPPGDCKCAAVYLGSETDTQLEAKPQHNRCSPLLSCT
jgi:hypothetical protein